MVPLSKFAMRLKEQMSERGLNSYSLSFEIGCQDQTIANWLKDIYLPRYNLLLKLSDYFGCSIDYLLGLSDDFSYGNYKQETTFFDRYCSYLKQLNLTSYKVSKDCRISKPTTIQWLKHDKMPETASLIALAKYFKCSVDFLLGRALD